ncbi:MAG TPA: ABC transporter permease [Pseudoflavonifractor sp.]|nr:ABC transporter permease [Pseudoflavonifractor sp.]
MQECNTCHTPFVRLAKRDVMPRQITWAIRGAALLVALFLGGLIISITTYGVPSFLGIFTNIFTAYGTLLDGALGKATAIRQTVKMGIPLLGCALAIAPCFKMRFWNIGAEGQITAGATLATYFALFWADKLPSPALLLVMAIAGMVGGGLWGLVPAFFKARWGTNETLFTLMMNYIIIGVVKWLQGGPWEKMPRGSQQIPQFAAAAQLPRVAGVYCGWIIVLVMTVLMFLYMKYTKQGYEIAVVGESENTARYAGMNVGGIVMRTMFISGAISGLVGFMLVSGANGTLYDGVAGGVGFTAITVAWLSQLNPFGMVAVSGLLAVLEKGADTLQTRMQVPASISDIMTGLVLFIMLGCEFFINYRLIFRGSEQKKGAKE